MMRRCSLLLLTLAALMPSPCRCAEGDWGYAHIFYIKKSLSEKWSAITGAQLTWRDNMSDLYFIYADAGLARKLHPNWTAEAVFRQGWWNFADEWDLERRPLLNLKWSDRWRDIRIENQARLEFRFYDGDKKDDLRFRNRTRVEFPWEILPGGIRPYAEEEFFIGRNSGELEMNWLMAGLYAKPARSIKLKAGYRWLAVRSGGKWENRNQLVTGLVAIF